MRSLLFAIPLLALTTGCEPDEWGPDMLARGQTSPGHSNVEKGRQVYATYCAGCHGENGDGEGRAAKFLEPKPRDFRKGRIKFAAVEAGETPRDEDYLWVITRGLKGTSMPSFRLMPIDERMAVIAYIKTFFTEWDEEPPGAEVTIPQDPWRSDPEGGVAEGKKVYHSTAQCWSCHAAYATPAEIREFHLASKMPVPSVLRSDVYHSLAKESQWGEPIMAPDFLLHRIKTGFEVDGLVRAISAGVGGTAMPTWAGSLSAEQLWGLAYYVRWVALRRGTEEGRQMKKTFLAIKDTSTSTSAGSAE